MASSELPQAQGLQQLPAVRRRRLCTSCNQQLMLILPDTQQALAMECCAACARECVLQLSSILGGGALLKALQLRQRGALWKGDICALWAGVHYTKAHQCKHKQQNRFLLGAIGRCRPEGGPTHGLRPSLSRQQELASLDPLAEQRIPLWKWYSSRYTASMQSCIASSQQLIGSCTLYSSYAAAAWRLQLQRRSHLAPTLCSLAHNALLTRPPRTCRHTKHDVAPSSQMHHRGRARLWGWMVHTLPPPLH